MQTEGRINQMSSPSIRPPAPCGPHPSDRQLAWHRQKFYGFVHFTVNTFTNAEWGYGDEDPAIFNPVEFDARQWAQVAAAAGMKGLVLTCKHHDGFCLWPSKYTEHSVRNSPWRQGRGDIVRDTAEACREAGIGFGVYLSPWDRNHPAYGRPEYIVYYRHQLRELLTEYGPICEVWFDGANGGTGFYDGAREQRNIERSTYYDWQRTWDMVRQLQPHAVMFSDAGPDTRWVGNEKGFCPETMWYTFNMEDRYPGYHPAGYDPVQDLGVGHEDGAAWVPPEVDVSIRPGWFYHAAEDAQVKTVAQLLDIYYKSIGRGANLILNIPPDQRGLFHETDVERLQAFRQELTRIFSAELAVGSVQATNTRGNAPAFAPAKAIDGNPATFWAADDDVTRASLQLEFARPVAFDRVVLGEYIPLGQRVKRWSLEAQVDGGWRQIAAGTTIGDYRVVCTDVVTASCVRFNILEAKACPTLHRFACHLST